jgi:hypothetical protein
MATSEFLNGLPLTGRANKNLLRDALVKRVIYPFFDGEDPTDWTANVSGAIPAAIANSSGGIFFLDAADETSAHDGVVVIVTDDGYRYKTSNMTMPDSVKGLAVEGPPADPEIGDAYITASAPTGDWSANPDEIAVYTIREWLFITPRVGRPIYVEGLDHYFMDENGDWRSTFLPDSGQIRDQSLVGGQRRYIVQSQTLNTPPGSPSPEVYWIIGPSPTGAWSGNAGKIATKYDGDASWTIITPKNGDEAYDIATLSNFIWNGTLWVSGAGAWNSIQISFTSGTGSVTAPTGTTAWNNSGTPDTGDRRTIDDVGLTYTARVTGKWLRFRYSAKVVQNLNGTVSDANYVPGIALYRDSETDAIAFYPLMGVQTLSGVGQVVHTSVDAEFLVQASNTASHTYKVALLSGRQGTGNLDLLTPSLRQFSVEEAF